MKRRKIERCIAQMVAVLLVFGAWLPAAVCAETNGVSYVVQEDFDWISFENMLQADWSCSALHPEELLDGKEEFSKLILLSLSNGAVTLRKQFLADFGTGDYCFDFSYSQLSGGILEWGFLQEDRQNKLVSVRHQANGTIEVGESSVAEMKDTQVTARVTFSRRDASAEFQLFTMDGDLCGSSVVDLDDATKVGGFYITLPQECRAETGAELFYLYGWNGRRRSPICSGASGAM